MPRAAATAARLGAAAAVSGGRHNGLSAAMSVERRFWCAASPVPAVIPAGLAGLLHGRQSPAEPKHCLPLPCEAGEVDKCMFVLYAPVSLQFCVTLHLLFAACT